MKGLLAIGLIVTLVRATPLTKKHEDFKMRISEKGANFEQEVDLDEEEHVVAVHVPAHNNLDDTYFITDFEKHLTVKVVTTEKRKICFLTKNDPEELPPAEVWRKTKVFSQDKIIQDDPTHMRTRSYIISGSVSDSERQDLPTRMKKACDGVSIVRTEPINTSETESTSPPKMTTYINYTRDDNRDMRMKRQVVSDAFVDRCPKDDIAQKCVAYIDSCYRVLQCEREDDVNGRDGADCSQLNHVVENVRCCQPCCLDDAKSNKPTMPCSKAITKEELCPDFDFV